MIDTNLKMAIHKIFAKESNSNDIKAGIDIKNRFCPKKFYKFRSISQNSIDNVLSNTIWFDNPLNMNDPYDCRFALDNFADQYHISPETYKSFYIDKPEEFDSELFDYIKENKVTYNEFMKKIKFNGLSLEPMITVFQDSHEEWLSKFIHSYLKKIYFCSFSQHFHSILMWTHYSQNHSGFCIEYDSSNINEYNPYINNLYPIIYTDKLFNISDYYSQQNPKNNILYFQYPIIYKSSEWAYENEWRVIHSHGSLSKACNLPTPPISSIILGSNFFTQFKVNDNYKDGEYHKKLRLALQLISHCKKKSINLKIMKHSKLTYSMVDIPISSDECLELLSNIT